MVLRIASLSYRNYVQYSTGFDVHLVCAEPVRAVMSEPAHRILRLPEAGRLVFWAAF